MSVLVTGHRGYLGQHFIEYLESIKVDYITLGSVDLLLDNDISNFMKQYKPTKVFHFAANSNARCNFFQAQDNHNMTYLLTKNIPINCQFVFASTSLVYPNNNYVCREHYVEPDSHYAISKIASEYLISYFGGVSARFVGIVGPNMKKGVIDKILRNDNLELLNKSPGSFLQYIHVEDAIRALYHISDQTGIYNIAPNDGISLLDIGKLAGKNITWTDVEPIRSCTIDNTKLIQSGYKFRYPTTLSVIKKVIEEYK